MALGLEHCASTVALPCQWPDYKPAPPQGRSKEIRLRVSGLCQPLLCNKRNKLGAGRWPCDSAGLVSRGVIYRRVGSWHFLSKTQPYGDADRLSHFPFATPPPEDKLSPLGYGAPETCLVEENQGSDHS